MAIYLGSPYSHSSEFLRKARFRKAEEFVNTFLTKHGIIVFSPIVYCHEMAAKYGWPTDAGYYVQFNMDILRRSDALFVLCLQGWKESQGLRIEMNLAKMLNLPIQFFNPDGSEYVHADNSDGGPPAGYDPIAG